MRGQWSSDSGKQEINTPSLRLPALPLQVVFGLVMGRAADVYNRKLIVFYGLVIWSFATLWLGLSNNFSQLLQSRVLLGIGQSFSMPASFSMIADCFPIESLAQVSARQPLLGFPYRCGLDTAGVTGGRGGL